MAIRFVGLWMASSRPEAMAWCKKNGVDYVFGLPGTKPLSSKVGDRADEVRVERASASSPVRSSSA